MTNYLPIGEVCVQLTSDSDAINAELVRLFGSWLTDTPAHPVIMRLAMSLVDQLPERPSSEPIFVDNRVMNNETGLGLLDAYQLENGDQALYFHDGGYIELTADTADGIPTISGVITPYLITREYVDDYITSAISPILRQHHYYFIHSSGVSYNEQGILFVGQTKSGKTTTCLNLMLNGWKLLSNDIIILHPKADGIYAYAMPDLLTLRPNTIKLLPALKPYLDTPYTHHVGNDVILSSWELFANSWSEPVRVSTICFPQINDRDHSIITPQISAITLARLLETSLDCWDEESVDAHTSLMAQLAGQVDSYVLSLGRDVETLPTTLINQLSIN